MGHRTTLSRRRFLGWAAATAAAPYVMGASAATGAGRPAPSERVTVGMIGLGGQGIGRNLRGFLGQPDAQVIAGCDVDRNNLYKGKQVAEQHYARHKPSGGYEGFEPYNDFRDILVRDDIDAVSISTPDHWHVPMSVYAMRAGKDVICEKPTLTVAEGRALSDTATRYGAVFQTSTEDRSLYVYHRMAELVRNGRIGRVQRVRVRLPAGPGNAGDPTPQPVPDGFDWDLWLGPAPWAPYCPGRTHWNFRWIIDYSGGMLTDWGAHQLDTVQWAGDTETTGPVEVEGHGKAYPDGLYNTFHEYHLTYRYANGVELLVESGGTGLRFEGTDGWVGNDGWARPVESSRPEILQSRIGPGETHLHTCRAGEHRDFLDAVHARRDPYQPAEIGHRVATIAHIGNIAMWTGRKLRWDPETETFPGDAEANRYLARSMRSPWAL
ncbi:MAG: Gfo/Idh/MocA family oxidoreductase [Phycisphaerae bacterium]